MSNYAKALGARLRDIRNQQGLSLQGVETKSSRRWKAVVVGSYERGDRAITTEKLAELALFYGIPITELLPDISPTPEDEPATTVVLNLQRLGQLPAEQAGPLARYAATIQGQRGDYNGRVLSIRGEDLELLAVIYDVTLAELIARFTRWGVLAPDGDGRNSNHGHHPLTGERRGDRRTAPRT